MRHVIQDIKCNVGSCVYNEGNSKCTAGQIEVGPSHATNCTETLCATFECQGSQSNN